MNDPHGITAENLLRTLPVGIGWDETIQALGALAAETLSRRPEEIRRLLEQSAKNYSQTAERRGIMSSR